VLGDWGRASFGSPIPAYNEDRAEQTFNSRPTIEDIPLKINHWKFTIGHSPLEIDCSLHSQSPLLRRAHNSAFASEAILPNATNEKLFTTSPEVCPT
jgi:hypothetical protein